MVGVKLENISKKYKNFFAVKNVNLEISDGDFVVILGPSGCGKTTTLRMIAGLEIQSSGHIYFGEKLVDDLEPKDRNIAMVFQSYALYPHMTVFQNISFGLMARKVQKEVIRDKVEKIAEKLQITETLNKKPAELSGGQRQRVALARALVREPELFLFDEPLSNLDARLRTSARIDLKQLHNDLKKTMVYVTHDQIEAMTLADKIAIMNKGELLQYDTPLNIMRHPVSRFVADFIGYPPINMIEGELRRNGSNTIFRMGGISLEITKHLDYEGPCVLGLRPYNVVAFNSPTKGTYKCSVSGVERTIGQSYVFLESDFGRIIADGNGLPPTTDIGDTVYITLEIDSAFFFNPVSGENVG